MLLLFLIRVAECPPVWKRAVHSVNCTCLLWALVEFCVCLSFPFGIEGGIWDVIPHHCLSVYFTEETLFPKIFALLVYLLKNLSYSKPLEGNAAYIPIPT